MTTTIERCPYCEVDLSVDAHDQCIAEFKAKTANRVIISVDPRDALRIHRALTEASSTRRLQDNPVGAQTYDALAAFVYDRMARLLGLPDRAVEETRLLSMANIVVSQVLQQARSNSGAG